MNRDAIILVGFLTAIPLAVEVPVPADSGSAHGAETRLRVAGGYGYYAFVDRGCEGQIIDHVPVHAQDGGIGLDHRFEGMPLRVGARGGWTRDEIGRAGDSLRFFGIAQGRTHTNRYVNPFIELDHEDAAISIGYVFHDDEFITAGEGARTRPNHPANDISAHLRMGRLGKKYFQVSWMEGVPLYSDGGYFSMGIGGQLSARRMQGFAGIGAGGPMEGAGLILRGSYAVTPRLRLQIMLRGSTGGAGTVGLGAEYRLAR